LPDHQDVTRVHKGKNRCGLRMFNTDPFGMPAGSEDHRI